MKIYRDNYPLHFPAQGFFLNQLLATSPQPSFSHLSRSFSSPSTLTTSPSPAQPLNLSARRRHHRATTASAAVSAEAKKKLKFDRLMDNITNSEQDSTVRVISRASLAQPARRQREGFSKRSRDEERARRDREALAERPQLEQDTIAQEQENARAKRNSKGKEKISAISADKENSCAVVAPLRRPSVGIVIRDNVDLNAISTRPSEVQH